MLDLKPGDRLQENGTEYRFTHATLSGDFVFKCPATGAMVTKTREEVEDAFVNRRLELTLCMKAELPAWRTEALKADFLNLPSGIKSVVEKRMTYCNAILDAGKPSPYQLLWPDIIGRIAGQLGDKPPHWKTVARWLSRFVESREDGRGLIPGYKARGRKRKERSAEEETFLTRLIGVYVREERPTMEEVIRRIKDEYRYENKKRPDHERWVCPSASTIRRMIRDLDPYYVAEGRYGKRAAKRLTKMIGQGFITDRRLQIVEIDSTEANVLIVETRDGMKCILGRPTITVAIDKFTRMIVGIYIGFEPPSTFSLMQCLRNMMLPKTYLRTAEHLKDLNLVWNAYGIPSLILSDNAAELRGDSYKAAASCFGWKVEYAPVKMAEYKGCIERFNKTLTHQGHSALPGKTFSNILEKGEYASEKRACMTLQDFEAALYSWLISQYCNRVHRGINAVPAERWEEATRTHPIRLPNRMKDVDILLGINRELTVQRSGISINRLQYRSPELDQIALLPRKDRTIVVKIDPANVGQIAFIHPNTGEVHTAQCVNKAAHGLTRFQWAHIRKMAQDRNVRYQNQDVLLQLRMDYYALVDALYARQLPKSGRRKQIRARAGTGVIQPISTVFNTPAYDQDIDELLDETNPKPLTRKEMDRLYAATHDDDDDEPTEFPSEAR